LKKSAVKHGLGISMDRRAGVSLDRHATYIVPTFIAGAAR